MKFGMNNTKEMYFTKLLEDLTGLNSFDNEKLEPLLEHMDFMSNLMEDLTTAQTQDALAGIGHCIRTGQEKSIKMMSEFLYHHGTTGEQIRAYFSNPNILSKKEWEIVRDMNRKLLQSAATPDVSTKRKRKGRKKV